MRKDSEVKEPRGKVEGRYFIEGDIEAPEAMLPREECRHALKARRLRAGSMIEVFDGRGRYRIGLLEPSSGERARIRFLGPVRVHEGPERKLTLALSPPKKDRMTFAVEKLSELGADRLIPTVFRRSLDAGVRDKPSKAERWQRTAKEAAKQCGRYMLLDVAPLTSFHDLSTELDAFDLKIVLLAGGEGRTLRDLLHGCSRPPGETLVLVGPEGGFTAGETARAEGEGFLPASLGERILRTETAAIAAAAIFRAEWP